MGATLDRTLALIQMPPHESREAKPSRMSSAEAHRQLTLLIKSWKLEERWKLRFTVFALSSFVLVALIPLWFAAYFDKPFLTLGLPIWAGIMGGLVLFYWRRDAKKEVQSNGTPHSDAGNTSFVNQGARPPAPGGRVR